MKQEKWITVFLCIVLIIGTGIFYLRSGHAAQKQEAGFAPPSTAVEDSDSSVDPQAAGVKSTGEGKDTGTMEHSGESMQKENGQTEYAVYICGAVKHPGVYHFAYMARVCDVVEAAGGLKKNAAATSVNQARYIEDGEQIQILTKKQEKGKQLLVENGTQAKEDDTEAASSARVNINKATEAELMTLSGIGQSKAKAIVDYRTQNGAFGTIEDIMKVTGIKEGVYAQIKDSITV